MAGRRCVDSAVTIVRTMISVSTASRHISACGVPRGRRGTVDIYIDEMGRTLLRLNAPEIALFVASA